jgi:hypothetical protein
MMSDPINQHANEPYIISDAVEFDDSLEEDRLRVQAADIGIRLQPREPGTMISVRHDRFRSGAHF